MVEKKWRKMNNETEVFEIGKTYRYIDIEFVPAVLKKDGKECLTEYDVKESINLTWNLLDVEILE